MGCLKMKKARVVIDKDFTIAAIDEKVFSSFVEPLGRCVYGGLYEPEHESADEDGFRRDVMEYIEPLNLTLNRFREVILLQHTDGKTELGQRNRDPEGLKLPGSVLRQMNLGWMNLRSGPARMDPM